MAVVRSVIAVALVALALVLVLPAAGVFAHAELSSSEPPNGGTLATTPAELTLHFSQNLVTAQSWVAIRDAQGGDTHHDEQHKRGRPDRAGGREHVDEQASEERPDEAVLDAHDHRRRHRECQQQVGLDAEDRNFRHDCSFE